MKIKDNILFFKIAGRILFILLIVTLIILFSQFKQNRDYKGVLKHYLDTYIYKQVSVKGTGTLDILSVDGGKNWYTYEIKDNGGIRITGTFEEKRLRVPVN